jgi:hypothetical protein
MWRRAIWYIYSIVSDFPKDRGSRALSFMPLQQTNRPQRLWKPVFLKDTKYYTDFFIILTLFSNNNIHGNYSMWHHNISRMQYNSQNDYYLSDIGQEAWELLTIFLSRKQQLSHWDINKTCKLPSSEISLTLKTEAGISTETLKLQRVRAQETQTLVITLWELQISHNKNQSLF